MKIESVCKCNRRDIGEKYNKMIGSRNKISKEFMKYQKSTHRAKAMNADSSREAGREAMQNLPSLDPHPPRILGEVRKVRLADIKPISEAEPIQ